MKKIIFPSLLSGFVMSIVSFVVHLLFGIFFPSLTREYQNPALFRPWSDPLMSLFFLYPFVLGFILSFVWEKTKAHFSKGSLWEKALRFSLVFWLVTNTPGMLISYSTFPVSLLMILTWSLGSLIMVIPGALVIVKTSKIDKLHG